MSSDRDSVRQLPSTLDWMPRLDLMLNNIIAYPTSGTNCPSYTALCINSNYQTAARPVETIFHPADPARGIPATRVDGNVYANTMTNGTLAWSTLGGMTSIDQFRRTFAAAPVSLIGLETRGLDGTKYINADGSPTAALAALHSQAMPLPANAELNEYLTPGAARYGSW
jgi:hypothetical protein